MLASEIFASTQAAQVASEPGAPTADYVVDAAEYPTDEAAVNNDFETILEDGSEDSEAVIKAITYVSCQYDTSQPECSDPDAFGGDPAAATVTIPECLGHSPIWTYDDCRSAIRASGFDGTLVRQFATLDGADVTKAAGAVLGTRPAGAAEVNAKGVVRIDTNPLAPDMPITVPDCTGLAYGACVLRFRDAGATGDITRAFATLEGADLSKPAEALLSMSVTSGTRIRAAANVTITTNPLEANMPRVVPNGSPAETATAYADRIRALALHPSLVYSVELDSGHFEDETGVITPTPGTRVLPGTDVQVQAWNRPPGTDENRACEIAPGQTGQWNVGTADQWSLFVGELPNVPPRSPGPVFFAAPEPGGTTVLRWGTADAELSGWGFRHIHAKHGWTNEDALAAQQTLTAGLWAPGRKPGRVLYRAPINQKYTGLNGVECRRVVILQRTAWNPGEQVPGIITSYGEIQP
jgi:hypothetical protein